MDITIASYSLPLWLKKAIEKEAKKQKRSASNLVTVVMEKYLQDGKKERK